MSKIQIANFPYRDLSDKDFILPTRGVPVYWGQNVCGWAGDFEFIHQGLYAEVYTNVDYRYLDVSFDYRRPDFRNDNEPAKFELTRIMVGDVRYSRKR